MYGGYKKMNYKEKWKNMPVWLKTGLVGSILILVVFLISSFASGDCNLKNMNLFCAISLLILFTFGYPFILVTRFITPRNMPIGVEYILFVLIMLLTAFFIFAIIGFVFQRIKKKIR